jgi:uncharacterized repeat protein (TIGR03803 family)
MKRPKDAVISTSLLRYGVSLSAAAALLAGCGGSQPPLSVSPQGFAPQQSLAQQAYHIIHPFGRSAGDGTRPAADLIDVKGTLYGTTMSGGSHNAGTVFSITTNGQETVLHSFGGSGDGVYPLAALLYVNGTFYGTTEYGGTAGGGTVFSMTPDGSLKVLHNFVSDYPDKTDTGSLPKASLIDVKGILYGTTFQGGKHTCNDGYTDCGTVFSITTSGKYTLLHSFGGSLDGAFPEAALLDVNGTLYGTTSLSNGGYSNGTVFSITPAEQYHVVYSFGTNPNDGQEPKASLIDVNGALYGTTSGDQGVTTGNSDGGNVFSITPSGTETVLHSFSGSDGYEPLAALKNVKGVLYGTTAQGGANNLGTVFSITKSGTETVVKSFANRDGVKPVAGVIAVDHTLYGTTYGSTTYGAKRSFGNVFSLTP